VCKLNCIWRHISNGSVCPKCIRLRIASIAKRSSGESFKQVSAGAVSPCSIMEAIEIVAICFLLQTSISKPSMPVSYIMLLQLSELNQLRLQIQRSSRLPCKRNCRSGRQYQHYWLPQPHGLQTMKNRSCRWLCKPAHKRCHSGVGN